MKNTGFRRFLPYLLIFFAISCSDDKTEVVQNPIIEITDKEIVISSSGNTTGNTVIYTNVNWNITGGSEWCQYSPGTGTPGTSMVYFSLDEYDGYSDRNTNVTLNAGGESSIITIIQKKKDALTISKDKFEIPQQGETIKIQLSTNIEYFVKIPTEYSSWITQEIVPNSRALENPELYFKIWENENSGSREGRIIIEDEQRQLSDTIRVYQAQKDMLILTPSEYRIPLEGLTVDIELKSNVDYDFIIPSEVSSWIRQINTRSLRTDMIRLQIDPAPVGVYERDAELLVKDRNSDLQNILYIKQLPEDAILLTPREQEIVQGGGTLQFNVQANVSYQIIVPSQFSWIVPEPVTDSTIIKLNIQANPTDKLERRGRVIVKATNSELADTVYVFQKGRDRLDEREVLTKLYYSLKGNGWSNLNKTNWLVDTLSIGEWRGVTLNEEGYVKELNLSFAQPANSEIPPEIGDLKYLEKLAIGSASTQSRNLGGEIPKEIGCLTNLIYLSLNGSFDYIPDELIYLEDLKELYLLTDATNLPEVISNLTNLEVMRLLCKYEGPIPNEFGNLKKLRTLSLGASNNNSGFTSMPSSIGGMTALTELYIYCNLTGAIPPEIGNLTNLTKLTIRNSGITSIPDEIGQLKNLVTLDIQDNMLTSIPAGIGGLISMTTLYMQNNQLTGPIPDEIGNLVNITSLNLNNNRLTGEIPSTIGNLKELRLLYLNNNQLSGEIPYEIGDMENVSSLYLQQNQLSGRIPASISNLKALSRLTLNDNNLTGGVPGELVDLSQTLKYVFLQNNRLSGELPEELALMQLSDLNLQNNNLTGSIPAAFPGNNFKSSGSLFNLNGNRLTGEIPEAILIRLKAGERANWLITEQQEGYGFTNWP